MATPSNDATVVDATATTATTTATTTTTTPNDDDDDKTIINIPPPSPPMVIRLLPEHTKIGLCCCCIQLKTGVVIISAIWLINSMTIALNNILAFQDRNGYYVSNTTNTILNNNTVYHADDYSYDSGVYSGGFAYNIPVAVVHFMVALAAIYGLGVLAFWNSAKNLRTYSYLASISAFLMILLVIVDIFIIIADHELILRDHCAGTLYYYADGDCFFLFATPVISTMFTLVAYVLITVYFAMVIAAYAEKRTSVEEEGDTIQSGAVELRRAP